MLIHLGFLRSGGTVYRGRMDAQERCIQKLPLESRIFRKSNAHTVQVNQLKHLFASKTGKQA